MNTLHLFNDMRVWDGVSTDGKLEASLALHGTSAASMARAAWSQ